MKKNFKIEKIDTEFESPDGKAKKIECIYQIWSKYKKNDLYNIEELDNSILKIYSLSDGGTPSTTRNKKMFNKCDIYMPSTCFGKDNMKYYNSFNTGCIKSQEVLISTFFFI